MTEDGKEIEKNIETKLEDESSIASNFNKYFAEIGKNLASKIQYTWDKNNHSFLAKTLQANQPSRKPQKRKCRGSA